MSAQSCSYIEHLRCYEKAMHRIGFGRTHGARRLYAQTRYRELTGREAPAAGGPGRKSLSVDVHTAGKAIGQAGGYISAIATAHGLIVASRDRSPFEAAGLDVIDPWQSSY